MTAVFQVPGSDDDMQVSGRVHDGRLIGEMHWGPVGWTPFGGRRWVEPKLVERHVDEEMPTTEPSGADAVAEGVLLQHALAERSSALVVLKDGKVVIERYLDEIDGSFIMAMSASKSIASLAIGMLIAEKKLSLDTTMGSLFPEWKKQKDKARITVRQLLSHTSGLDPSRAKWSSETIREHALAAKLVFRPGSRFQYNNGAADFLAVVFRQAAGEGLDTYLDARLFKKIGAVGAEWMRDKEGTPRAAGELAIRPIDLAKIGQLMLDGGKWKGEQIVPHDWVETSVAAGQPFDEACGLLWWREGRFSNIVTEATLDGWSDAGVEKETIAKAKTLLGKKLGDRKALLAALEATLGKDAMQKLDRTLEKADHVRLSGRVADGPATGFSARGWLGQILVVRPAQRVVAVRMRRMDAGDSEGSERSAYPELAADVAKLYP